MITVIHPTVVISVGRISKSISPEQYYSPFTEICGPDIDSEFTRMAGEMITCLNSENGDVLPDNDIYILQPDKEYEYYKRTHGHIYYSEFGSFNEKELLKRKPYKTKKDRELEVTAEFFRLQRDITEFIERGLRKQLKKEGIDIPVLQK